MNFRLNSPSRPHAWQVHVVALMMSTSLSEGDVGILDSCEESFASGVVLSVNEYGISFKLGCVEA
jgi:hypothetical protein